MRNTKLAFALTASLFVLGAQANTIILDAQPEAVAVEVGNYLQEIKKDYVEGKADPRSNQNYILIRFEKSRFKGSCSITVKENGMNMTISNSGTSMKKPEKCVKELKRLVR